MPLNIFDRLLAIRLEIRALWRLAWPMLIGQLATIGMGVSDVVMTGHVSPAEVAAVSLGASIWVIFIVTIMGVMMAVNTVVAHEFGAGNVAAIPRLVRQALWQALIISIAAFCAANLSIRIFDSLGLDEDVHEKACAFVRIVSFGLPALTAYRALYGYSASLNHTKPMMIIALGGLCYNIVVNWLLVFGHYGLPKLGAIGCAIATATGLWLMLGSMAWWIHRSPDYRSTYPFDRWERPNWQEIGAMLKLGVPIGVAYFAEISAFSVVCILVAKFGVYQMAANQIALNFDSLAYMVPFSFGIGMITRVGQALGDADPLQARFSAIVGVSMAFAFGLLTAIPIALFRFQIAALYTSDPTVQTLTANLLLFAAFFQISDSTQVAAASAIRGYKVARRPMLIQLCAFWMISIPIGYVLGISPAWFPWRPPEPLGAAGFWIGLVVGLTVAACLLVHLLNRLSKQHAAGAKHWPGAEF